MAASNVGTRTLHQLARLYGVQTAYYDVDHRRQPASVESLLAVLRSMGAHVKSMADVPSALRDYHQQFWRRPLAPVIVDWEGFQTSTELRLPEQLADVPLVGHLRLEDGERERWEWLGKGLTTLRTERVEGQRYVVKELPLKGVLPPGYHNLRVDISGRNAEALIISAPRKAYSPSLEKESRTWGVFLPLYALRTSKSLGNGYFSDLEAMTEWVAKLGGSAVATLPLLASFLDEPFDPSPYSPVSRLFWNELYVDVNRAPEIETCAEAQELLTSPEIQDEISTLLDSPLVDYRRQAKLHRRVLETLSEQYLQKLPQREQAFTRFVKANPAVEDYASFRAVGERLRLPWSEWPENLRKGIVRPDDYDEDSKRYHMYTQWLASQQMADLSTKADERGSGLYLDLPLGVHPDGYDVWRNQELFGSGTRVGAPPDGFFTHGQDWGFPPIHPGRIREQGYKYLIDVFRHHFRHAGILRIDHVMSLHRLYWIPEGHDARYGAYVKYNDEEMYAIMTLESHRQQTWVVGENLGTVPSHVNRAMSRHGLGKMYVAQFETSPSPKQALNPVSANTVASFNTHDLPTFASFWQGLDIEGRKEMGLIDDAEAGEQKSALVVLKKSLADFLRAKGYLNGEETPEAIHAACFKYMSASPSHLVLVNLEDLWQEVQPQNVPGTGPELPNWRRKARYSLEEFTRLPEVLEVLLEIDRLRN